MKHLKMRVGVGLVLLTGIGSTSKVMAADQILNCSINLGGEKGEAQIKVLQVEGHPEFQVFDLKMKIKLYHSGNHDEAYTSLQGLLVNQTDNRRGIYSSGMIYNQPNNEGVIINPELATLQGYIENGVYHVALYDTDKVLQKGFGLHFNCR